MEGGEVCNAQPFNVFPWALGTQNIYILVYIFTFCNDPCVSSCKHVCILSKNDIFNCVCLWFVCDYIPTTWHDILWHTLCAWQSPIYVRTSPNAKWVWHLCSIPYLLPCLQTSLTYPSPTPSLFILPSHFEPITFCWDVNICKCGLSQGKRITSTHILCNMDGWMDRFL